MPDFERLIPGAWMRIFLSLILLLLGFGVGPARADAPVTVDLARTTSQLNLARDAVLFEDPSQSVDLRHILQLSSDNWRASASDTLPVGYSRSAWWVRLAFTNSGQEEQRRIVEIGWPLLDWMDAYALERDQVIEEIHTGDQRPIDTRPLRGRAYSFVFAVPPGATRELVLRLALSDGVMDMIPLRIWNPADFASDKLREILILGLFYGACLVLTLYNLLLYASTRDGNFLNYAAYLGSFTVWNFGFRGYGILFLWPGLPWLNNLLNLVGPVVVALLATRFVVHYLETRSRTPWLHQLIRITASLMLIPAGLSVADILGAEVPMVPAFYAHTSLSLLVGTLFLIAGVRIFRAGYRPAAYFLLAWTCLVAGVAVYNVSALPGKHLPNNVWTEFAINIGSTLEFLLLALALGDRYNRLKDDKLIVEQQLLAHQRAYSADLEREVAEQTAEARAANAAKSQFLAHMSHEIRTPMNGMLGWAQVLQRETLPEKPAAMVSQILVAGQLLLQIVNDILDFSKIEANQLRIDQHPFDPAAVLNRVINLLSVTASNKNLGLRLDMVEALPCELIGDAQRLQQILVNLIGNALKFTAEGEVRVRVLRLPTDGESVRLRFEIQDTGIGMTPETLSQLFQPFAQADTGITRRFGGTGLGLAISKQLTELMGGRIGGTSTEGVGSTFWFELPC